MITEPVSLIIVSQKRPKHLSLLLQSLRHQTHSNFEIVVVADFLPPEFENHVKYIPFYEANISAARNVGVSNSAAEIIAFCDDDAIPDPPWLEKLVSPFVNKEIGASTGFTRGRNGIRQQWGSMQFDLSGNDHPFEIDKTQPFEVFQPSKELPIKLIGTNMAFRKSALLGINGFDENYRFFLDETDAKFRIDRTGWKTAIVPNAQVHHGFAASDRRSANRVPTDLFEIGASKAYFCKTHMGDEFELALRDFTNEQLIRLTTFVEQHKLRRRDVTPLMVSLADGMSDGLQRELKVKDNLEASNRFHRFETHKSEHVVVCVRPQDLTWMQKTVPTLVEAGKCVSVIQLLPSPRYFQVSFKEGYWLHRGGVWGNSIRTQPSIQFRTYRQRFKIEIERISQLHQVDTVLAK